MGQKSFFSFIQDQWAHIPPAKHVKLEGRTVIVTGANTGLGLQVAKHFATMQPAKLIMAVRSMDKGQKARKSILAEHPSANIEVWQLDMASFASVKSFAERCKSDLDRLDFVVLNAGVSNDKWSTTSDGYEQTLQVNDISTGLLSVMLLPQIEETAKKQIPQASASYPPHLCLVASEVHFWAQFANGNSQHPVQELNDRSKFDGAQRYNVSKLLVIFIVRELAKRASENVVVNCVNPGFCHSELTREASGLTGLVTGVMKSIIGRPTETGARVILWSAINKTRNGAYTSKCAEEEESDYSLSAEGLQAQKKVWADLVEIWEGVDKSLASLA